MLERKNYKKCIKNYYLDNNTNRGDNYEENI